MSRRCVWEQENWALVEHHQKLAYVILVELLAYQIAPPVRWIETEDILFNQYHFERLIEIGPSPTLTGRATDHEKRQVEAHQGHPVRI